MFNTILLATDGSDLSDKAVQAAIEFAKGNGGKIVGLSVEEPYHYYTSSALTTNEDLTQYQDAIHAETEANVNKIATLAKKAGVSCEVHTTKGSPHEEIVRNAGKYHCDVIFMASHGRKGLNKLMLGSETQKVMVLSKVPVVVFK